jgi:hypothetical protein
VLQLPFSIVMPSPLNLQMKALSWAEMKCQLLFLFFLKKRTKYVIALLHLTGLQWRIGTGLNWVGYKSKFPIQHNLIG